MYRNLTKILSLLLLWFGIGWLMLPFIAEETLRYVPDEGSVNFTGSFILAGIAFLLSLSCFIYSINAKPKKIHYKHIYRCPKCNHELLPGTEYCPYCGSFIK